MKIGDLVEIVSKPGRSGEWVNMRKEMGKSIGVVLETQYLGSKRAIVKVEWLGTYGAFWTHINDLTILSKIIDR
jgi:hypothetical protein